MPVCAYPQKPGMQTLWLLITNMGDPGAENTLQQVAYITNFGDVGGFYLRVSKRGYRFVHHWF